MPRRRTEEPEQFVEDPVDQATVEAERRWAERGVTLRNTAENASWALGDWLVEGSQWDSGFRKSRAITGYSKAHLYNTYRTAGGWPPDQRSKRLSFTAHTELLFEPDYSARLNMMTMAEQNDWTAEDIRDYFRANGNSAGVAVGRASYYQHVQVACPHCAHVFPVKGHKITQPAQAQVPTDAIEPEGIA